MRCDGRALRGRMRTPSRVAFVVAVTVCAGLFCSASMTVNSSDPRRTNGAGNGGSVSRPVSPTCSPVLPLSDAPLTVRSTFELALKPCALIRTGSPCGSSAVPAVT
jgi:hypothetical protein